MGGFRTEMGSGGAETACCCSGSSTNPRYFAKVTMRPDLNPNLNFRFLVLKPVYFVSRVLRDAEERYSTVEKAAYALLIVARKPRPYFQAHPVVVLSELPLKKALGSLDVAGRLLKWAIELSEYDITYAPKTSYKGQVLADFVIENTGRIEKRAQETLWTVHVDGAASDRGSGLGVQIKGANGEIFYYAIHITFKVTNNTAEYEALLAGLRLLEAVGAKRIKVLMDSQLVICHILNQYEVHDPVLAKYLEKVRELVIFFDEATFEHIPRSQNEVANALSKLEKQSDLNKETPVITMEIPQASIEVPSPQVLHLGATLEWYTPIWEYLELGKLPSDNLAARRIKRWAPECTIMDDQLLKKGFRRPWLQCISESQGRKLIKEIHEGICGSHQSPYNIDKRIEREGYFWPTMRKDMIADFVRHNIVYRFGIPHTIISDNGRQFIGGPFQDLCDALGIKSLFSSVSHPQINGLVEVSNRTTLEGLKKKVEGTKGAWPDFLDEVLWSYNTTPRKATDRSPFAMVYGMEAVTPMEMIQPTLRTLTYDRTRNNEKKLVELEAIYELREEARKKMAEYQRKMRRAFDKKVAPRHFQRGDWVLRSVEATGKHIGKLDPA
ncbi:hypothetical protein LUZ61_002693 [Rhynchospora tenuis]|uniref:Integrase catalytic domain-containing protein n=1 Tax=Rhynchospora tenuis TaxID=198213 RepID=A0AAD5ZJF6_9POAL|nr:hypothetical protein LUZ61_002693 [Rhynchospora tenuis]